MPGRAQDFFASDSRPKKIKTMKKILLTMILAFGPVFMALASAGTPVGENGWLSVKGRDLVNEKGNPVILSGVSIGWHNLWPRFYNAGAVEQLSDEWGCDVVRAAIGAELDGNFASDPQKALDCLYSVSHRKGNLCDSGLACP